MPVEPDPVRAIGISLGAGVFGAIQPDVNAALGERLGSSLLASLINFVVAFLVAATVVSRRPGTRRHLAEVRRWPTPRWTRAAGLGGATVVLAGVITVERLGIAVFSIAFFAGQMTFGLVVDRLGIAPGGQRPITRTRIASVIVAMAAVGLAQVGQPVGDLAPGFVLFVVAAGGASALQSACNGRIASASAIRSPPPCSTWWSGPCASRRSLASPRWRARSRPPGGRVSRGSTWAAHWG